MSSTKEQQNMLEQDEKLSKYVHVHTCITQIPDH